MRLKPPHIVLGVTVLAATIAVIVLAASAGNAPGASRTEGSRITYKVAEGIADASIDLPVTLKEGGDAAHESEHVFESIAGLPGAVTATFDTTTLQLTIGYDSSVIDAATLRQQLYLAGYTPFSREDATAAERTADGALQRIAITADGGLQPRIILAEAGLPIEMVFSSGTGCLASVSIPDLGVTRDISQGGTVTLPALEQGSYALACGQGALEGTLIVE